MSRQLNLKITTPFAVIAEIADVRSLRAEDASGSFGILPGHVDLLTVLPVSVLRWEDSGKQRHYCALRSGILTVKGGDTISVACRQAMLGDDLDALAAEVAAMQAQEADDERSIRTEQMRIHARAVRQLMTYLQPGNADSGSAGDFL